MVGFNPGGDSDLNNRLMAQYVEPELGQSIAVTNMAGSNSSVALTQYQSTPTDGYTILGTNTSALVNNYASGTCQYSYEDFEVVAVFGRGAGEMLFANKASGITSMEDLLEKSKANPNTIKMGMSSGGNTHVYALLLQQAGFECNIVDGGDGSDRIAALVGGHVDVCFVPYLTAKEYIENGDVVPLCTIGDRCSALPDTPSINENGYVKNNFNGCYVWLAPKGTDAGIVSYLASLCEDVCNNNEKYAEDQRAINFNDPFVVTGQDALDFLAELQQTAIGQRCRSGLILKDCVSPYLGHTSIKKRKNGLSSVLHRIQAVRAYCVGGLYAFTNIFVRQSIGMMWSMFSPCPK